MRGGLFIQPNTIMLHPHTQTTPCQKGIGRKKLYVGVLEFCRLPASVHAQEGKAQSNGGRSLLSILRADHARGPRMNADASIPREG